MCNRCRAPEERAPSGSSARASPRQFDLSAVLVYPNSKDVAFASLGFLKVLEMLRARLQVADLAYLPRGSGEDEEILSAKQRLLLGMHTRTEVKRFDILAFSVSYENDYLHVPELLIAAGLEPLAEKRSDAWPLVISGGFTMSINPLPIADFVDAVVVGEAEPVLDPLLATIEDAKVRGLPKPQLLRALARLEGVYVPSLGETNVKRVWSPAERIADEPTSQVASHFGEMHLVEVGRGCGRGCLFCAAGNLYRPVRRRDQEVILEQARDFKKVGLVGTAVGDHPALEAVLKKLVAEGRKVGVSSLRADQVTPEVADLLVRGGMRTIAIAPEAGSEVLRHSLNKGITDLQIFDAVRILADAGIVTVKLYFMIGLPGETDQDVESVVDLVRGLAQVRGRSKLSIAVGPFVPKPHTALQWAAFADKATLARRVKILRRISKLGGCSLKVGSLDEAWTEAVLSRGDRALSRALLEAAEKKIRLRTVLKCAGGYDPSTALDMEKPLPWDFIASGITGKGLKESLRKSQAA